MVFIFAQLLNIVKALFFNVSKLQGNRISNDKILFFSPFFHFIQLDFTCSSLSRHSCVLLFSYPWWYLLQGSFISKIEWLPFKCLFWNASDSIVKLTVYITSSVSLRYRTCYKNMLNYDNNKYRKLPKYKNRFSLIVEQILAFASSVVKPG